MGGDRFTRELFDWTRRISRDRALGHLAVRVALVLSDHFNRTTAVAWPSQETLADIIGVTPRSVRSAIDELHGAGHLEVDRAGARRVNQYRMAALRPEACFPSEPPVTGSRLPHETPDERKEASGQDGPDDRNHTSSHSTDDRKPPSDRDLGERKYASGHECCDRKQASSVTGSRLPPNHLKEPSEEGKEEPTPPMEVRLVGGDPGSAREPNPGKSRPTVAEVAEFEAWWQIYPRRVAKQAASEAFVKRRREGVALEPLIAGAQAYAGERAGRDPEKTAHAATWLNGRRWEDEITPTPLAGYQERPTPRRHGVQGWSGIDQAIEMMEEEGF